jgi:hypothetical protein
VEFKFFFFKTLYLWTIRFAFPNLLTFHDFGGFFFFFFFFFLLDKCFSCVLSVYMDCDFCFLMIFQLLTKKKKKHKSTPL